MLLVAVGKEGLDFGAEADAAVAIRLVADVYDAGSAERFFLPAPGDVRRHAQSGFDGHTNRQGGGRCEVEPAAGDIQNFRKMLGFVRS